MSNTCRRASKYVAGSRKQVRDLIKIWIGQFTTFEAKPAYVPSHKRQYKVTMSRSNTPKDNQPVENTLKGLTVLLAHGDTLS